MKSVFKRIILCSMLILSFAFISACGKDNDDKGNENIAPSFESFEIVGENNESLSFNGNNDSVSTLSYNSEESPFGEGKKTIEEKINEEIDVGEQITIDYTADVNEYIYAITNIKNPSNKVISSITISGQRYTINLFENESTKEKLIIKLFVGNISSIKNYTLESIKYIDDSSSKDITITGNVEKIVKVGTIDTVSYTLNNLNITDTSASFSLRIIDNDEIINKTQGKAAAILYDGDNIIKNFELNVGTQTVTFDNLDKNKVYQYAIVVTYDQLDGNGKKNYILTKDIIETFELEISKLEILNEGNILLGNPINVKLEIYNPYNVEIKEIYLNNVKTTIIDGNKKTDLEVVFYPPNQTGEYSISVTKILCKSMYSDSAVVTINSNKSDSINVISDYIDIVDVLSAHNDYKYVTKEESQIILELDNPFLYDIYSVTINDIVFDSSKITKINNNQVLVQYSGSLNYGYMEKIVITNIVYGTGTSEMEKENLNIIKYLTVVKDNVVRNIANAQDLKNIQSYYVYSLQNDINLNNEVWESLIFSGVFIGNGHKVYNFKVIDYKGVNNYKVAGFFGKFSGGLFDFGIENASVTIHKEAVTNRLYAGLLVGYLPDGIVDNCYSSGAIDVSNYSDVIAGGLIGSIGADGELNDCHSSANIKVKKISYMLLVGGLVGALSSEYVNDCYSTGSILFEITGVSFMESKVGGLIGIAYTLRQITNSYSTVNISGTYEYTVLVNGLMGKYFGWQEEETNIIDCYSNGSINITKSN